VEFILTENQFTSRGKRDKQMGSINFSMYNIKSRLASVKLSPTKRELLSIFVMMVTHHVPIAVYFMQKASPTA
jgi:uncharacterized membrane protein YqjE